MRFRAPYMLRPLDVDVCWRPSLPSGSLCSGDSTLSGGDPRVHFYRGGTGLGASCRVSVNQGSSTGPHPGPTSSALQQDLGGMEAQGGYFLHRPHMVVCSWDIERNPSNCLTNGSLAAMKSVYEKSQLVRGFYAETDK